MTSNVSVASKIGLHLRFTSSPQSPLVFQVPTDRGNLILHLGFIEKLVSTEELTECNDGEEEPVELDEEEEEEAESSPSDAKSSSGGWLLLPPPIATVGMLKWGGPPDSRAGMLRSGLNSCR